jgi:hypothetical protein
MWRTMKGRGRMTRRCLGTVATMAALSLAASAPAAAQPIEIGHIPECLQLVPAAISLQGDPTTLDVRVLLDGVALSRGQQVLETARKAYAPLGITLSPSYQSVSFTGSDAEALIAQAKALFGGQRPAGTDVVYTLTSKDIAADGMPAVAGLADCIGGVAFPSHAFAVGENFKDDQGQLLVPLAGNLSAKVMAHEIGHLMGGHHHYANCVEGLLSEPEETSPCTLMFNDVGLTSFNFSTVNSLIVRGHSEAYAGP